MPKKTILKSKVRLPPIPPNKVLRNKKIFSRKDKDWEWVEDGDNGSGYKCPSCGDFTSQYTYFHYGTVCGNPICPNHGDNSDNRTGPEDCLLYTSPSPRDRQKSRMPSST